MLSIGSRLKTLISKRGCSNSAHKINPRRFMILGRSRVGSNYLSSILDRHKNIRFFGELFNLDSLPKKSLKNALKDPPKYLREIIYKKYPDSIKAVGFKMFYYHATRDSLNFKPNKLFRETSKEKRESISKFHLYLKSNYDLKALGTELEKVWAYLLKDLELRIIHLKRQNILRTWLSTKIAFMTNKWTSKGKGGNNNLISIHLDYDDCVDAFEKTRAWEQKYDKLFHNHKKLEVMYEDMVQEKEKTMKNIFNFLDVPHSEVASPLKKQNTRPLSKAISNYWELKEKFQATYWIEFFEE